MVVQVDLLREEWRRRRGERRAGSGIQGLVVPSPATAPRRAARAAVQLAEEEGGCVEGGRHLALEEELDPRVQIQSGRILLFRFRFVPIIRLVVSSMDGLQRRGLLRDPGCGRVVPEGLVPTPEAKLPRGRRDVEAGRREVGEPSIEVTVGIIEMVLSSGCRCCCCIQAVTAVLSVDSGRLNGRRKGCRGGFFGLLFDRFRHLRFLHFRLHLGLLFSREEFVLLFALGTF